MTPKEGGRHCTACAQTVTDFTMMSDVEILETSWNNTSGYWRFRNDQLDRELVALPAEKRSSFAPFYKVAVGLVLVFSAGEAVAQEQKMLPCHKSTNNTEASKSPKINSSDSTQNSSSGCRRFGDTY